MDHITLLRQNIHPQIREFLHMLNQHGEFFLVGGCVRDAILGRIPKDFDIVTTTPDSPVLQGMAQIGKSFPVWQTQTGPFVIEIAAARKEVKTGLGHGGFEVQLVQDIHQDLLRRDLTINALAWDGGDGLFYPQGALGDLENKALRPVSEAFSEDPLRVFRLARFRAQLGFYLTAEAIQAMQGIPSEEILALPKDRVREELSKALKAPYPEHFFTTLLSGGHLHEWFPELHALVGCHHSDIHHPEGDAFIHTLCVLRKARELGGSSVAMLGALVHDFGKSQTPVKDRPRYINHEVLGLPLVDHFCDRLGFGETTARALKFCTRNHMHMHKITDLRPTTLLKILAPLDRMKAHLSPEDFALVCQSDHCGRGEVNWNPPYPQRDYVLGAMKALQGVRVDPLRLEKFHGDGEKIRAFVDAEKAAALKVFKGEFFKIK